MKLLNRERRIRLLGFDDTAFVVAGIFVLSWVTTYLFNSSFFTYSFWDAFFTWFISLFFTICNWLFMRAIVIQLRVKYPELRESTKRITYGLLLLVLSVFVIDFIGNIILHWIFGFSYHPIRRIRVILPVVIISVMVQAIYEAIYHFVKLKKAIREEEEAKQMMVQAQLDALRNQAQPHFLFNTLNTLRDIIDENTKEEAKEFVDKIADVYRFILESGNSDLISLRNEMKFVKSYIHIQKERFGDNLQLKYDIPDHAMHLMIVPMSLQLLLENAIKHNVISRSKPLLIDVKVKEDILVVENKIQRKSSQTPSTKLGLKNIERRYNLISSQSPKIANDGVTFKISLPLLESSNQKLSYADIDH
ncbi:MAG: histidine kinase [Bacteroidota bacterium]